MDSKTSSTVDTQLTVKGVGGHVCGTVDMTCAGRACYCYVKGPAFSRQCPNSWAEGSAVEGLSQGGRDGAAGGKKYSWSNPTGRHALSPSHPCRLPRQTNVVTPAAQSLPLSQSPLLRASVKTPAASVGAGNTELCSKEVQNCGEVQPGTVMVKPLLLPRFVVG